MAISDFLSLMPHTVSHAPFTSYDDYGKRNHGSSVDYTARVLYKDFRTYTANGQEVLAKGIVWFGGTPSISPEDEITLPDGSTPIILSVETVPDCDGTHHVKVIFGHG